MRTLYLCGAGNSEGVRLALRVNEAEPRWDRIVLLDDAVEKRGRALLGVEVIGGFDRLAEADPLHDSTVNLVARTTEGRRGAGEKIASYGIAFAGLVAPGVDLMGAALADDVLVYPGAVIGPEAEVGPGSVVFMGAVVGHEARVGAGCVVAANAVLNARVNLGDGVYVGSNATVLPEIHIGAGATVGAGSTVLGPVPAGATVLGVPADIVVPGYEERERPPRSESGDGRLQSGSESGETRGESRSATALENLIAEAWAEALDLPSVAADDRVFDLGATSICALQVVARVRGTTGIDLAVVDLFRFPTVRQLVRHLTDRPPSTQPPPSIPPNSSTPLSPPLRPPAPTRTGATVRGWVQGVPDQAALAAEITNVFRDVLGPAVAGPDSHFFDLGGDPASAQRACAALERLTGEPLCFMQVARYPTPTELARHLVATAGQPPSCPAQGVMNRLIHRHEWQRG